MHGQAVFTPLLRMEPKGQTLDYSSWRKGVEEKHRALAVEAAKDPRLVDSPELVAYNRQIPKPTFPTETRWSFLQKVFRMVECWRQVYGPVGRYWAFPMLYCLALPVDQWNDCKLLMVLEVLCDTQYARPGWLCDNVLRHCNTEFLLLDNRSPL